MRDNSIGPSMMGRFRAILVNDRLKRNVSMTRTRMNIRNCREHRIPRVDGILFQSSHPAPSPSVNANHRAIESGAFYPCVHARLVPFGTRGEGREGKDDEEKIRRQQFPNGITSRRAHSAGHSLIFMNLKRAITRTKGGRGTGEKKRQVA